MSSNTSQPGSQGSQTEKGNSPVTGIIDEKLVIIDFGKYEGKSVSEVQEIDPNFYQRLATEKENGVFAIRRQRDKTFRLYITALSNIDH
jgi:hypothetical protein